MLRRALKSKITKKELSFTYRGVDNTRIEALSDGVFAIATALLVISTSIPSTFQELINFLSDFVPFVICITLLTLIWYQHYTYFLRYGFKDAKIVSVNTILLLLILFYVYPLKFLFSVLNDLFVGIFTQDQEAIQLLFTEVISIEDAPTLMVIYGLGVALIFLTLAWMYWIAYKRKDILKLSQFEIFETQSSIYSNLAMASVPLLSVLISFIPKEAHLAFSFSGWAYFLYPLIMIPYSKIRLRIQTKRFKPRN